MCKDLVAVLALDMGIDIGTWTTGRETSGSVPGGRVTGGNDTGGKLGLACKVHDLTAGGGGKLQLESEYLELLVKPMQSTRLDCCPPLQEPQLPVDHEHLSQHLHFLKGQMQPEVLSSIWTGRTEGQLPTAQPIRAQLVHWQPQFVG